jgi:hypothetical protein
MAIKQNYILFVLKTTVDYTDYHGCIEIIPKLHFNSKKNENGFDFAAHRWDLRGNFKDSSRILYNRLIVKAKNNPIRIKSP